MPSKALRIVEGAAGDLLQALGYEVRYPELIGSEVSRVRLGLYYLDNVRRKVLSRALGSYVQTRFRWTVTAMRASARQT